MADYGQAEVIEADPPQPADTFTPRPIVEWSVGFGDATAVVFGPW